MRWHRQFEDAGIIWHAWRVSVMQLSWTELSCSRLKARQLKNIWNLNSIKHRTHHVNLCTCSVNLGRCSTWLHIRLSAPLRRLLFYLLCCFFFRVLLWILFFSSAKNAFDSLADGWMRSTQSTRTTKRNIFYSYVQQFVVGGSFIDEHGDMLWSETMDEMCACAVRAPVARRWY